MSVDIQRFQSLSVVTDSVVNLKFLNKTSISKNTILRTHSFNRIRLVEKTLFFNSESDQHLISPDNIASESHIKIKRIREMITH